MYTTIKTLNELGKSKSEIARVTGHDWKTVQKVIREINRGVMEPQMKERRSTVEPYKETVIKLMGEGLTAVRIHEELVASGFTGKYSAVKKYVRKIKGKEIFIRVHTPAGHEAQVDFGYVGRTKYDAGVSRKTWVFNMRLSHSRFDYYETFMSLWLTKENENVIPAKAGIQKQKHWIPVCTGMTNLLLIK